MVNNNVPIRDITSAINRDLVVWDEEDGVSAVDSSSNSLGQSFQFVCKRVCPCLFVIWTFDEVSIFHGGTGSCINDGVSHMGLLYWLVVVLHHHGLFL